MLHIEITFYKILMTHLTVKLGGRRDATEVFDILGPFAASMGNLLPTFRNVSVPTMRAKCPRINCETHYRHIPKSIPFSDTGKIIFH